ncbi:D-inositol-3-phosphate glycosyltransferase [Arthrobacter roseus]|uniref:D-inositol-3-phosphate glycosyltransferase n=1 Tax=Arthrobacter roseus TaxID=136274 RepID=UPI001963BA1E|nr:D-inositol-3-phosphate glycosyltransferase [Arthrobacter roseus]
MTNIQRVAMLSLHTSPLEQPGSGDAGGMNVYVRSMALELAKTGIDVEIFTRAHAEDQAETEELAPGVIVRHVPAGPRQKVAKERLPELHDSLVDAVHAIQKHLSDEHFDVVHSHYWVSGIAGLRLAKTWKLPLVHTMHTMGKVKNLRAPAYGSVEPAIRIKGEQKIVDGATRLIANTRREAGELATHYGAPSGSIDIIPPGVNLEIFHPAPVDRASLDVSQNAFHLVFAGRIQRLKGPQILIEAAARLAKSRPDIPLKISILGSVSGAEELQLEPLVQSHGLHNTVSLHPAVQPATLATWLRSADVVVMPSFSESFGLVALEAQACGTPVLAANVGGLPQAVSHGRTGLLVDGHDPALWAAELEKLYDDAGLRQTLANGAAIHARAFGWNRTAMLTAQSYRNAVEDFGSPSH